MRKTISLKGSGNSKNEKRVLKYVERYKKKFGLNRYCFYVVFSRAEKVKGYYAEVTMDGYRVNMIVNADLMDSYPNSIRDTVIHELLHVVLYRLMRKFDWFTDIKIRQVAERKKLIRQFGKLEHEVIDRLIALLA